MHNRNNKKNIFRGEVFEEQKKRWKNDSKALNKKS